MNAWLESQLENRSVGEVSFYYTIIATGSFVISFGCFVCGAAVSGIEGKAFGIIIIATLIVWLGFLVWLWRTLVKAGRVKLRGRAGVGIFKMIKYIVLGITAVIVILRGEWWNDLDPLSIMLLASDILILFLGLFFFPMAWSIGCKIPKKAYLDFAIVVAAIVVQIWTMF
jgi:hypothetical protein